MTEPRSKGRCAIYTRKSSEEGLDQAFNSLHAQREACEAYILSQKHEGWQVLPNTYDDGGFSGGNMERPGLKKLLADISAGKIDTVVVYKVDRLTRSLSDFARIVESFDSQGVSFVSVTQQFNTTSSMGRLTLNSFLEDAVHLAEHFCGLPIRDTRMLISAAAHQATLLRDGAEQERAHLISRIVSNVVVQSDALEIEIIKGALKADLLGAGDDDCEGAITLRAPCHFAKRGNEVRLILESGAQPSNPNPAVVKAVAQAKTWYEWITKGEVFNMRGLARRTGFNENYVSRILDLSVLSPDITEAILRGDHDPSLTVAQLTATLEIDWMRQRLPRIRESRLGSAGQVLVQP